ncbi:maker551 [Drosophila busckii]|uniref:Semaphorin-1A n=1 Tax=Drosophila busckii TaxID=30019 RepID=A0A0M3QU13_DROBS|nr:maker551 [Drosophila busckii]
MTKFMKFMNCAALFASDWWFNDCTVCYRFTQIAVDAQIKTPGGKTYDVIFVGTDHGKIIKSVNAESADTAEKVSSVVIEEIDVLTKSEPIRNLEIVRTMQYDQPKDGSYDDGKLIIVTDSQVIAIQLHRCHNDKITSCSECVALQDPYCAWDKIAGKCRSHGAPRWLEENYFYQNVATGQHAACPSGKINSKDANVGEQKGFRNDMDLLDSRRQSKDQEIIDNIDKNFEDIINAQYTVETLVMAVLAGSVFSLLVGFFTGYFCGRRCHKDEDDNLPYPDTEYEYFEQRQNVNSFPSSCRIQQEPKLLPQVEEVTYAEPVLLPQPPPQNKMHSPKNTLRKPPMHQMHQGPNSETLFQFQPDGYNTQQTYRGRDNFGTLRSHQVMGDNYRRGDGFSTTRSVKKPQSPAEPAPHPSSSPSYELYEARAPLHFRHAYSDARFQPYDDDYEQDEQHDVDDEEDELEDTSSLAMITPPPPYDQPQLTTAVASSVAAAPPLPPPRKFRFGNRELFSMSPGTPKSSAITPTKLGAAAAAMFATPQMAQLNRKWAHLQRKRRRRNSSNGDSKELDKLVLQSVDWDENEMY